MNKPIKKPKQTRQDLERKVRELEGEKIIRCPNSTTTFKSAKGASTTTSDGG